MNPFYCSNHIYPSPQEPILSCFEQMLVIEPLHWKTLDVMNVRQLSVVHTYLSKKPFKEMYLWTTVDNSYQVFNMLYQYLEFFWGNQLYQLYLTISLPSNKVFGFQGVSPEISWKFMEALEKKRFL